MLALASRVLEFWSVGVELELDWSGGCPIMPLDDKPLQIICIYHPLLFTLYLDIELSKTD